MSAATPDLRFPAITDQAFPIHTFPLANAQEALQLTPVEADDNLAVNHGDWGRLEAEFQKFLQGLPIRPDILRLERNARLRKKLLLCVAAASPRLRVDDYLFGHCLLHVSVCWNLLPPDAPQPTATSFRRSFGRLPPPPRASRRSLAHLDCHSAKPPGDPRNRRS